jgi:steroid Delta-isomerase
MAGTGGATAALSDPIGVVRRYYDLVDANDVDGLVALFSDDAVYNRPGYQPLFGRRELERFYREQRVIERGAHRLVAVVADGRAVAVQGEFSGTLRDGRTMVVRFADFFVLSDTGSFARRDTFFFAPLV